MTTTHPLVSRPPVRPVLPGRPGSARVLIAVVLGQLLLATGALTWIASADPAFGMAAGATQHLTASGLRATALSIPKLGVHGELAALAPDPAGGPPSPPRPDVAGWFTDAAAPGERGATVIAGRSGTDAAPGVFRALAGLVPGDRIDVTRSDGRTAGYRVTRVLTAPDEGYPSALVSGPAIGSELRLVSYPDATAAGSGGPARHIVVSAVLTDPP